MAESQLSRRWGYMGLDGGRDYKISSKSDKQWDLTGSKKS